MRQLKKLLNKNTHKKKKGKSIPKNKGYSFIKIKENIETLKFKENRHNKSYDQNIKHIEIESLVSRILKNMINADNKEKENQIILKEVNHKHLFKLKGLNITKEIIIKKDTIKNNTPYTLTYKGYNFYIRGADPTNSQRVTWHCQNYLKNWKGLKNKSKFCNSTIQGQRLKKNSINFIYYFISDHSENCIKEEEKKIKDKMSLEEKINIDYIDIKDKFNENIKIENKNDFLIVLEKYIKDKKLSEIKLKDFQKYGNEYYINKKLNEKFVIDNIFLKNAYYRITNKYFNLELEGIYDYCNKIKNNQNFCRNISLKQIINKEKKVIDHKAIIFFTDFDIKRLINSEHLLLDGTFIYPKGFIQTIIIMYFDIIVEKMVPGIFILINNKTSEGYLEVFAYIKYYIDNLVEYKDEKIKFKTFTTDFEKALFSAFDRIFNKDKKIKHIGCYFHFIQNIRKYLQKNHLTKLKYKAQYDSIMNTCKNLPFLNLKNKDLINHIKNKAKLNEKDLNKFILYFKNTWLEYFISGELLLNNISL